MSIIAKVSLGLTRDSLACESNTKSAPIQNLNTPRHIFLIIFISNLPSTTQK